MHDTIGKEHYSLVLSHYPIFSWRNMGRGRILLYGHTHESEEDRFYQKCLSEMRANDCRHVYEAEELRAYNVGCMAGLYELYAENVGRNSEFKE